MTESQTLLFQRLDTFIAAYVEKMGGKKPRGLLLGPQEYVMVSVAQSDQAVPEGGFAPGEKKSIKAATHYGEIPIRCKLTAGCEPELAPEEAFAYLKLLEDESNGVNAPDAAAVSNGKSFPKLAAVERAADPT